MSQTIKQQVVLSSMIVDHHTAKRQAFIAAQKLKKAIRKLGVRWVLHKKNPDRPRKLEKGGF